MTILIGGIAAFAFAILFFGTLPSLMLRRVVPTNMVHIVQSGRKTRSFGSSRTNGNVYYRWPAFMPVFGVTVTELPESVFVVGLDNYASYDSGRLPFMVDVRAFFRIADSDVAANRVAHFAQLTEQLTAILQGAVRRVLAAHPLEQILGMRAELGDTFTKEVEEQLTAWGVTSVKSIEFMDMRDAPNSTVIHDIMSKEQARISRDSRIAIATNQQQAQLQEIDAQRTVEVQKQDAIQQVGLRTAQKDSTVGMANESAKQSVLDQAKVTTEKTMAVRQVEDVRAAEIARQVAEVQAAQNKNVTLVNAEAARGSSVIAAEGTKQTTELMAQGNLAAAKNEAEGTQAKGAANAEATKLMELAPVQAQITLAKEIGENQSYQEYLIRVAQIQSGQVVGVELASAIGRADLKIIANSGDIQGGVSSIGDMFTAKGGTNLTAMLAAISQTDDGKAILDRLKGKPNGSGAEH